MSQYRFSIYRTSTGFYRWRLCDSAGNYLAVSGTEYPTYKRCESEVESLKVIAREASTVAEENPVTLVADS